MSLLNLGIFDNYTNIGDLVSYLNSKDENISISLIGLNIKDQVIEDKYAGSEEILEDTNNLYSGAISASTLTFLQSATEVNLPRVGNLLISGEYGDRLAVSKYILGTELGGLTAALQEIGFDQGRALKYADQITDGQVLIIVQSKKIKQATIYRILQLFGSLENDTINTLSPK